MIDEKLTEQVFQSVKPEPCGEDPSHHDLFAAILEERDKGRPPMPGTPDWGKVERDALTILATVGKHLPTMSSLVVALAFNRGGAGLADGLDLFNRFLDDYWQGMFPPAKRKKGRIKAANWLNDRLAEMEKNSNLQFDTLTNLERALTALDSLRDALMEKLEGLNPPTFYELKQALEAQRFELEKKEQAAKAEAEAAKARAEAQAAAADNAAKTTNDGNQPMEPVAQTPPAESPSRSPTPGPPTTAAVSTGAASTAAASTENSPQLKQIQVDGEGLDAQLKALADIAINLRNLLPSRPIAYRLLRTAVWTQAKIPNIREGKETYIPAPNDAIPQSLNNQVNNAAWADLLNRCEELLHQYRLWIDLQFFAVKAARGLGGEYQLVADVIEQETTDLVDRLPALRDLCFDGGLPLVSADTRVWLDGLQRGAEDMDSGSGEAEAELRELLQGEGKQKYAEALATAQNLIATAASPMEAMRLKLQVADFLLDAQQGAWALQLLRGMAEDAENHQLGHWEPRLAGRIWSRTLRACRGSEDEAGQDLERKAMQRLAALDIAQLGGHKL